MPKPLPFFLQPHFEAQEIHSPLTEVAWRVAAADMGVATSAFVLVAGSGTVAAPESDPMAIAAPCVIWLPPGDAMDVLLGPGSRGVRLRISASVLSQILPLTGAEQELQRALARPMLGIPADAETVRRLAQAVTEIVRELADDRLNSREACLAHLQVVAIHLLRLVAPEPADPVASPQVLVQNFVHLLELNVRRHWRLRDYARELGVSADRLVTAVHRATGATPTEMVHRRLIQDACQLLSGSTLQVAEVALALGFGDAAYFNRFFTRHVGISPGRFRTRAAGYRQITDGSYAAWP